jgi:hypothetical protein
VAANKHATTTKVELKSFYFEPFEIELTTRVLKAEFFMASSASSSWQTIGTYSGKFSTASVVADLADAINTYTLTQQTSNIIASPVLADSSQLYKIDFQARERNALVAAEVISVRFNYLDNPHEELPFKWGTSTSGLNNQFLNSVLLTVQQGKAITTAITSSKRTDNAPIVLYFKRAPIDSNGNVLDWKGTIIPQGTWGAQANLTFRISPTMSENKTVSVPYNTDSLLANQTKLDAVRPNQVAELLLESLFQIKGETLALGALIRNDYPDNSGALVAIELIAFSVTNPQAWMILDLVELPVDVQVAVGNLTTPLTPFSSKPRSIRVESKFYSGSTAKVTTHTASTRPSVVNSPVSDQLQAVRDHDLYRSVHTEDGLNYVWPRLI